MKSWARLILKSFHSQVKREIIVSYRQSGPKLDLEASILTRKNKLMNIISVNAVRQKSEIFLFQLFVATVTVLFKKSMQVRIFTILGTRHPENCMATWC